jgi:hypothetical protein
VRPPTRAATRAASPQQRQGPRRWTRSPGYRPGAASASPADLLAPARTRLGSEALPNVGSSGNQPRCLHPGHPDLGVGELRRPKYRDAVIAHPPHNLRCHTHERTGADPYVSDEARVALQGSYSGCRSDSALLGSGVTGNTPAAGEDRLSTTRKDFAPVVTVVRSCLAPLNPLPRQHRGEALEHGSDSQQHARKPAPINL